MIARRSIALPAVALALTTFGATSAGAQTARGTNEAISAAAPTPIDGVYQVTITADELAAVDPADVSPYTHGEGTLVFDRGWVRLIQESDAGSSWASGTFALRGGNILVMTWAGAGGLPGGGLIRPVEIHKLRWSVYRDQLTFMEVPGALSLAPYRVKPWRRIADAPSVTFKTPATALVGVWSNGRRVLVLGKGRFSLGKKAAGPARGNAYAVLGDAIRFRTSVANGGFWDYTWSIERGLLKLSHPPGNSLFPFWNGELIRKPWHRVRR
jgi:hypothetical protein